MLVSGGNETKVAPDDPEPWKVVRGKLSALIAAPEAEQPFDAKHPITKRAMSQAMVMQVRERLGDSKVRAALRGSLGGMRFTSPLSAAAVLRACSPCRAEMPISARPDVRARARRVSVTTASSPRRNSPHPVSRRPLSFRAACSCGAPGGGGGAHRHHHHRDARARCVAWAPPSPRRPRVRADARADAR